MPSRPRLTWILSGLGLSLLLPLLGTIASKLYFPTLRLEHLPFHSMIETVGGLIAIAIAGILIAEHPSRHHSQHYIWMASALIGMGVLDLCHAAVLPGNHFVWLHSVATFVGGSFFACVWARGSFVQGPYAARFPWLVFVLAVLFGVASCTTVQLPAMTDSSGDFTPLARSLNVGGGIGFFIAATFFIRRFHRDAGDADWLFAVHTMLFGAAGILFELSTLWDAAWWWWHILRLVAYAAAFVFAVAAYLNAENEVLRLNLSLKSLNAKLDQTVEERTSELRASEERFALAVRGSTDGLWDWDLRTNEVFYSPRFKELLGYTEEGFPNVFASFETRLHEDDLQPTRDAIESHLHHQSPYDVQYRLKTQSGEYRWFRARGQAIWDDAGKPFRMAGSITDITEQRLAQERFRRVIEGAPNAMVVVDRRGSIQLVNAATEQMFGYSREELINHSVEMLVPVEFRDAHVRHRNEFIREPATRAMGPGRELTGQRRDGAKFPVEIGLSPIQLEGQSVVLASIYDATKRRQAEDALVAAKEAAESASRAKSDFLANMSHEIRTPMNAIIGMTELVLEANPNPIQKEYLTIVLESAESLLVIINQILDFSKIEAGRLELESIDFCLHDEVGDTQKVLGHRAHAKQLELAWQIDPDVPSHVRGDATRLRQVLVNLVGNAIKFTHQGEVVVEIRRQSSDDSHVWLNFIVRDSGIGIPADRQQRIFQAFEQADTSTTRQYGGTGLGLAISDRIIEAMHGSIGIESEPDKGTSFHFTVQLELADAPDPEPFTLDHDLADLTVLVVDDNETNRLILNGMLENWGIQVATAADGRQALEWLLRMVDNESIHPILISDVSMPGMDGFTLAKEIRSREAIKELPIVLLTSGSRVGDAQRCQTLGIVAQLIKPAKHSELFDAITTAAGRRPAKPEAKPVPSQMEQLRPLKILLVEDGKANQILAKGVLTKWGHSVDIAQDGCQGVEMWQQGAYDVILMDVQMPVMDGMEATHRIRELEVSTNTHIPIVAMTAHAMKGDRDRCLQAGMDGYIAKPFRRQELYETLRQFFSN
jgi:two-component system sensor histidine kinase/response regulator